MKNFKFVRPAVLVLLLTAYAAVSEGGALTVEWDPPTDTATTGYIIRYGTEPGLYSQAVDAGFTTSYTVDQLSNGGTYYFAIQAYDALGQFSETSAEVAGMVPAPFGGGAPAPAPATCTPVAPSVSLSTISQSKHTVTVKDNRSVGCTVTAINLSASAASGWAASFSPASFSSVSPGATVSSAFTLIPPTGASGLFSFSVSAKDTSSGYTGTASGSITLTQVNSLEVSTAVTMTSDRKGTNKSATITPSVRSGQAPLAAADVQITLTKPNGASSYFFGTTGADGTTSFTYQIKPKDPSGTYLVKTTAKKDGVTGNTNTSFVVQ